ncbi:activity-regulated cytoskeleton associated protein 2-like [Trichoplusia ni]|uniref:Activity-regulated cytoskeleton associated protein 2-like n=1 Tax=Trichoplusia ni TaxID=7111 RepID=A0A7E5WSJ2_TRINI|nr:activity-regulated cytoskeleton associated protein 2-like [Trichoplusia ni]
MNKEITEAEAMEFSKEQFKSLLETIQTQRRSSFVTCKVSYDGTRDRETVETFLSVATAFKAVENISDEVAIMSVPLILKGEAAIWWSYSRKEVNTWAEFQEKLRFNFAPRRPAYIIYQDIMGNKQEENELTDKFLLKKRALFGQLPEPSHSESQQLDMIYGLLRLKIRWSIPRDSISTYEDLMTAARRVEQLLEEEETIAALSNERLQEKKKKKKSKKARCGLCRLRGHSAQVCRMGRQQGPNAIVPAVQESPLSPTSSATSDVAPPSQPTLSCQDCGVLGVIRSNCQSCLIKTQTPRNIRFW